MKFRLTLPLSASRFGLIFSVVLVAISQVVYAQLALLDPAYDCNTRQITFRTSGGDGSRVEYMAPGVTGWTTTATGSVDASVVADGSTSVLKLFARQSGKVVSRDFNLRQLCGDAGVVPPPTKSGGTGESSITLTDPSYDCNSRQITFRTSGGNGSVIEYMAPGITGWTTNATNTVDAATAADGSISVLKLFARQNGKVVSRDFNLRQLCGDTGVTPPPTKSGGTGESSITLTDPSYDCNSRQITFRTSGGNGSVIEYMAPGITGWTTNATNTVDAATAADASANTLTLFARQNGKVVSRKFSIQQVCK